MRAVRFLEAFAVLDLAVRLGLHAARSGEEDDVGDAVDDLGELSKTRVDDGEHVADAREDLDAVVEADESVVALIRCQPILVHHDKARRRDRQPRAPTRLAAHARSWEPLFAARPGPTEAATCGEVPLTAHIIRPLGPGRDVVQRLVTHVDRGAETGARTPAREAAQGSLARRLGHADLKSLHVVRVACVLPPSLRVHVIATERFPREATAKYVGPRHDAPTPP